jgi:hypothetical protein
MIRIALLLIISSCMDEPPPTVVAEQTCNSSTLPEHRAEWDACRSVDVDSWPVFCEGDGPAPPCVFVVSMADGAVVTCRTAGACQ